MQKKHGTPLRDENDLPAIPMTRFMEHNFAILLQAAKDGRLVLVEAQRLRDGANTCVLAQRVRFDPKTQQASTEDVPTDLMDPHVALDPLCEFPLVGPRTTTRPVKRQFAATRCVLQAAARTMADGAINPNDPKFEPNIRDLTGMSAEQILRPNQEILQRVRAAMLKRALPEMPKA